MAKVRCEYRYSKRWGSPLHIWTAIGAAGGMHLHITDHGEEHADKYGERYSGGIECHYRYPPDYMRDAPPSDDACWLLKCPCWHDGSSLQAEELWIPRWERNVHNHDEMFTWLEYEMRQRFKQQEQGGGDG